MARTFNTLFLLASLDGRISTGDIDARDADKDLPKLKGIKEGLGQYYEIEKRTDLYSLNTGRVMAKVGMNAKNKKVWRTPASFVIIDRNHLTKTGVINMLRKGKALYIITTNRKHPAFSLRNESNLKILYYNRRIDFKNLFTKLRNMGVKRVTIQSGGTLNATLLRSGLIDEVSIVVAPALIGGKGTSSIIDGKALRSEKDLKNVKALKLKQVRKLNNSYLHLLYSVMN